MKRYNVAVAGTTGAVGQEMLRILEERKFPVAQLRLLASERSVGRTLIFKGQEIKVEPLRHDSFNGIDIALFSAGASRSKEFAPSAVKSEAVVIDNSSAYRMDEDVPLVVPEVNPQDIKRHKGIIANPNCSTIQMVVVLKPLHDAARIRRIVVSTYQSASGAGANVMRELLTQAQEMMKLDLPSQNYRFSYRARPQYQPKQLAFNLIPQIDVFLENGYTKEEMKMANETHKIMGDDSIKVTATCVRVPVFIGHSEAVNIETERPLSVDEARALLRKAPGVEVMDEIKSLIYPLPIDAAGKDAVFVGRLRKDESIPNGLNLWIVADNLRKGAALNAVQIAELLVA